MTGRPGTSAAGGTARLTGRGGLLAIFAACCAGLLLAHWASWGDLANATFFMASSLTAYRVRPGSLLPVVVSPPLLFLVACVVASALTSPGPLAILKGTVTALANSAWWMIAGMALTITIAVRRGLPAEVRGLFPGDARQSPGPAARAVLGGASPCEAPWEAGRPSSP